MLSCTYCRKAITDPSEATWKSRSSRKKKRRKPVPYHKSCLGRKNRAMKSTKWNVQNPLSGYGNRRG